MVAFFPDALVFCPKYPIACLKLTPLQERFAEKLTHRDYLGAVLNLGIDRSKLGDILVEETGAYLFCQDGIAQFICDNLTRIRHTSFCARQAEEEGFSYEPKLKRLTGTVASVRLDSLISLAFEVSRSSLKGLLEEGRVFVNGKLITSNGYEPREGDLVSVRGMGRFRYESAGGQSKKGRSYVTVSRYIG